MNLIKQPSFIALLMILLGITFTPSNAAASGKVRLDLPGVSISFKGKHHYKKSYKHSHYNKGYNKSYNKGYHNNRYYNGYNSSYNNSYNKGYSNYYKKRVKKTYARNYCPSYSYSRYRNRELDCYKHGNHFHCE